MKETKENRGGLSRYPEHLVLVHIAHSETWRKVKLYCTVLCMMYGVWRVNILCVHRTRRKDQKRRASPGCCTVLRRASRGDLPNRGCRLIIASTGKA